MGSDQAFLFRRMGHGTTSAWVLVALAAVSLCALVGCGDPEATTPVATPSTGRTIRGRIVGTGGAPIRALPIKSFVGFGHPSYSGQTDQDGRFQFDQLPIDKLISLSLDTVAHGLRVSDAFGVGLDTDVELAIERGKALDLTVSSWARELELAILWRVTELDDPGSLETTVEDGSTLRVEGVPAERDVFVVLRNGLSFRSVLSKAADRSLEIVAPSESAQLEGKVDMATGDAGRYLLFVAREDDAIGMNLGEHEPLVSRDGSFTYAVAKDAKYMLMLGDSEAERIVAFRSGLRPGPVRLPAADTINLDLRVEGMGEAQKKLHVQVASRDVVLFDGECPVNENGNVDVGPIARMNGYEVVFATKDQVGTAKVMPGEATSVQLRPARRVFGTIEPPPNRACVVVAEFGDVQVSAARDGALFGFRHPLPRVPLRLRVYAQGATTEEFARGIDPLRFRSAGHVDVGPDEREATIPFQSLFD